MQETTFFFFFEKQLFKTSLEKYSLCRRKREVAPAMGGGRCQALAVALTLTVFPGNTRHFRNTEHPGGQIKYPTHQPRSLKPFYLRLKVYFRFQEQLI